MNAVPPELYCDGCREKKPVADFTRERRTRRGYAKLCKACESARRINRQYSKIRGTMRGSAR